MHDVRQARTADYPTLVNCVQTWWGDSRTPEEARELSLLLPRLFLQHFSATSLVLEEEGEVRAFLIGFHSADDPRLAYIHFVGVDPGARKQGIARTLYGEFFSRAAAAGRTEVRAITSPQNTGSIAFHTAMGFTPEPGDRDAAGVPVHSDYDGPGQDRVAFRRPLERPSAETLDELTLRPAEPADFDRIVGVVDDWWERPGASRDLTRVFVSHFFATSLVAERDGELAGFVIGFLSPSEPEEAYIHFTGVSPDWRGRGLGRLLYERFFALARAYGRTRVKAITSPQNSRSIAFHTALGFADSDPISDYDGPALDRVAFTRAL